MQIRKRIMFFSRLLPLLLVLALFASLLTTSQKATGVAITITEFSERFNKRRPIDSEPGPVTQSGAYPKAPEERESQEETPTGFPFSLSTSAINFGARLVGTTSPQHVETLTNAGTAPLTISEIDIKGEDRFDFSASYSLSLPVTLAPGSHIAISLSFTPAAPW